MVMLSPCVTCPILEASCEGLLKISVSSRTVPSTSSSVPSTSAVRGADAVSFSPISGSVPAVRGAA
jgi:hypothetical protein